jgi:hypothetical protein
MTDFFSCKWWQVGWQGLTLSVPEEWNIGAIGGERQQGYLRLDGPDMPRVEIKWADAGTGFVNVTGLVDKYLKEVQKGKKADRPTVDRNVKFVSKRKLKDKKGLECFSWQSDSQGWGAAWYCPDCHRTVIIQIMGTLQEPVQKLAERIITGMDDHAEGDWVTWATYGFSCQTPSDFKLTGQKLMAGLIELSFARDKEQLHLIRYGMANLALKGKTLIEWGQKEPGKRLKKFSCTNTENTFRGHPNVQIDGQTVLPNEKVGSFVQHCLGKTYPDRVRAHLWHCEDSNRIYYVEGVLDREAVDLVDEVREHVVCHGQPFGWEEA